MKTNIKPAAAKTRKRILIMDDHPITRQGLSQLLSREADLLVCGEVDTAEQAFAAIKSRRPDLILTDLTLPGKSGLDFIREMKALHPGVKTMVLSMHDEGIYAERAVRAGAGGYVMKSESGEKLLRAIRQVLAGEICVSEKVSGALLNHLAGHRSDRNATALSMLTGREFEVFQLIGQGLSTRQIGERLHISGKTVETHRAHLKEKFNLKSGVEFTAYAIRWAVANQLV